MKKRCSLADKELQNLRQQLDKMNQWLLYNTRHPDFMKQVSLRNALLVKMESKKQQTTNSWWDAPMQTIALPITNNK